MIKQFELMRMILTFDALGRDALGKGADMKALFAIGAKERIGRRKNGGSRYIQGRVRFDT